MNIHVSDTYGAMSHRIAEQIIQFVQQKPDALICLAGGNTPAGAYRLLVKAAEEGRMECSQVTFVGLDEWVGLGPEDDGSCQQFMYQELLNQVGIPQNQIHFFNAKAEDLEAECKRIDELIFAKGPIDLILLGIGVNGHLGFNEPGVSFESYCHVSVLDAVTKTVGQKYFQSEQELSKGITLGVKHILAAKTVILAADGGKKADAVRQMIQGPVTNRLPASVLQQHPNVFLYFDKYSVAELEEAR